MKTIATISIIAALVLTSCTFTTSPEGAKEYTLDATSAIKVLEIIATK